MINEDEKEMKLEAKERKNKTMIQCNGEGSEGIEDGAVII